MEYDIHSELQDSRVFMTNFNKVTRMIGRHTCIMFVRTRKLRNDIMFIVPAESAYAQIGRVHLGDELFKYTFVSLFLDSDTRIILHELMHGLGIYHEQARSDRDNYVEIIWANIIDSQKYNFDIERGFPPRHTAYPPYSFDTVMHYNLSDWTRNGEETIKVKNTTLFPKSKRFRNIPGVDFDRIDGLYANLWYCGQSSICGRPDCRWENYVLDVRSCTPSDK